MTLDEKKRILVADDDGMIVDMLSQLLSSAGYELFTASTGSQAVEVGTTAPIDLAILDYRMPDMTGLDVGKTLRRLTSTRYVIMSVVSDHDLVMQAAGDGALSYLAKPLDVDDVLNVVKVQLERAAELRGYEASIQELEETRSIDVARAVQSSRLVNTAVGVIMEREKIPRDLAYKKLVRRARREQRKLVDVCDEILSRSETTYSMLDNKDDKDAM